MEHNKLLDFHFHLPSYESGLVVLANHVIISWLIQNHKKITYKEYKDKCVELDCNAGDAQAFNEFNKSEIKQVIKWLHINQPINKDFERTYIEGNKIMSHIVYPDLISSNRIFQKLRILSKEEVTKLIGEQLQISNKYLVEICGKYYYQHDFHTFECEKIR